ncbi:hypothetical protein ACTXT7_017157 [Hymenolepis weldensis]
MSRGRCLGVMMHTCLVIHRQIRKHTAASPVDAEVEILSPTSASSSNMYESLSAEIDVLSAKMEASMYPAVFTASKTTASPNPPENTIQSSVVPLSPKMPPNATRIENLPCLKSLRHDLSLVLPRPINNQSPNPVSSITRSEMHTYMVGNDGGRHAVYQAFLLLLEDWRPAGWSFLGRRHWFSP